MTEYQLKDDKKALKPMIIMFNAYKAIIKIVLEDIKNYDFDLNEFSVFEVVYHKERITVQDIKNKMLVANSSLTYILDKLEKKRLIKRKQCFSDKRVYYVSLTDEGLLKANDIFPKHYKKMNEVFKCLTDEEKIMLGELLKKVGKNANDSSLS
ncbi:MAG: MarR family transcriptional regulator [Acholeplasma sp.]|nr:MarR family transcriptional regulator [Acholeplasma sp.]